MGKSRYIIKTCSLLAALLLLSCASPGPITGSRYADRAVRPDDVTFLIKRERDQMRYRNYLLVEHFPNPALLRAGMPSRSAFEFLGKATGMELNLSSFPPAQQAMKSAQDVTVEWRTVAYWSLARRQPQDRVETADISVSFVKLTRSKAEIQYVGSPFFPALDQGWVIEQVNLLPALHNLKPAPKKSR